MKIESYHEGDRSEQIAHSILSTIAHIVPVPRPADYFGVDLFAHLFSRSDGFLKATGDTIAIQLKSNLDDINIASPDAVQSLHALAVPFFIGVVDRVNRQVALYSTLFRFAAYWYDPNASLVFDLQTSAPSLTFGDKMTWIGCGPPVAIAWQDELDHQDRKHRNRARDGIRRALDYWIRLESDAIAWKAAGLPMSPCPPAKYKTGIYPGEIPAIVSSSHQARLGPLLNAMQLFAFAFEQVSEAARQVEEFGPEDSRVVDAMAQYAKDHVSRINEFRSKLDKHLGPASSYIVDY
ncbi:MAG: hypothetical protein WAM82_06045 [Thermoanaerobaculia bacterium]